MGHYVAGGGAGGSSEVVVGLLLYVLASEGAAFQTNQHFKKVNQSVPILKG